jgi:hypothetical protein
MKTWIEQHRRSARGNFKFESFQSADALRKLLSEIDFGLCDTYWIEDYFHISGTLYHRDIFKCIQFLWAHFPFQVHLDFEPGRLTDSEIRRIYSAITTGHCSWDIHHQLPAAGTIVPVICTSDKSHLINFSGDQHVWPLYFTIGNI